jgi:hypothetical protein
VMSVPLFIENLLSELTALIILPMLLRRRASGTTAQGLYP